MSFLNLTTQYVNDGTNLSGIVCHTEIGKVATIVKSSNVKAQPAPNGEAFFVFPYQFPPYEKGAYFHSIDAAKAYALALAYEMHALNLSNDR